MKHRYLSSLDVAAESSRTGKVVIESMPQRSKHIKAWRGALLDAAVANRDNRRAQEANDNPSYQFTYGAGGMAFTVCVHERRRWYVDGDVDGVSVMVRSEGGYDHFTATFADLPPTVRAVAKDVRAAMSHGDCAADKAREKRREKRNAEFDARMAARHPEWCGPDGKIDRVKMDASIDRMVKVEEARNAEIAVATGIARRSHEAECAAVQKRISWGEFTAIRALLDAHPMRYNARADFDAEHKCKGLSTCRYRAPADVASGEPSGDTEATAAL